VSHARIIHLYKQEKSNEWWGAAHDLACEIGRPERAVGPIESFPTPVVANGKRQYFGEISHHAEELARSTAEGVACPRRRPQLSFIAREN